MTQKSEMGSKAGISKKAKSIISKSASMLLIAMAGFSMMSFTQDDVVVNNNDTNLNLAKQTAVAVNITEDCCSAQVFAKPGDEIKKIQVLSQSAAKSVLKADVENSKVFVAEAKERMLWSMSLSDARKKADSEVAFNFQLSRLYPEASVKLAADAEMINQFETKSIADATVKATNYIAQADAAIFNSFMTEHFSIKVANAAAQADKEMVRAFEKANLPFISTPTLAAATQADAEVINNYEAASKVITTIAVK